ncbi:exopolysaccharide biosynthesis protein [Desulfitobacterium metallireducens DSM 15288]|uniref:Exopolysaccharide biosynthesis protein n=1 Tax=Desulfitobacterium metallireducens DSM 15288 TaxID=871968 RepID=W0EAT9_9FIRM|nr:exopolysaccharide biosynthesis protein [Desulfitobacterium metallireducens DSM 15288]
MKELYVTTAMTTYTHQYLAHWFVNDEEIQQIMDKHKVLEPMENTDEKAIKVEQLLIQQNPPLEFIEINENRYRGYLLKVANPQRIQLVATDQLGNKGFKVEDFANQNHAVAAINAGGFSDPGGEGRGGNPTGILITDGKILHKDPLVSYNLIGFDQNDVMVLGQYSLEQIEQLGIRDAVSFGPFLIVNGEPMIRQGDGGWGVAPRTAIGQTKDGTVLLLVIDGRQWGSMGATLKDVQTIMLEHGAENAANLDGGSSSTLVLEGKVKNKPSSTYGPREVPSAFIVLPERNLGAESRLLRSEVKINDSP